MKRIVTALLLFGVLGASLAPSQADAYYRRPWLRRGVAAAARVGIGYGIGRGYGYGAYGGYGGYGYRGFSPYGYGGYGYRPGFGIGIY